MNSSTAFPAIVIDRLSKRFGSLQALQEVTLTVEQGEFFALLGANGAGKTTLISILAGLARADTGSARIMGHCVQREYRQARRMLGVVPQELAYDPFFTVRETLRIQSGYFGLRHNDDWIDEILTRLELLSKADSNMRSLSGGMKRRVLVAQALVHKPPVIILDEPTAGVDVALRQSLWQFIREINQTGHTIVLTTHYLEEAQHLCQRVAMLKQGQLVALEDTATLIKSAGNLELHVAVTPDFLPPALQSRAKSLGNAHYCFVLHAADELESVLCALREARVHLEDVRLHRPDLEDVFMQMMEQT